MKKYLTVSQMVECEQRSDKGGVSLAQLMDNAAEGLYREVTRAAYRLSAQKVCIVAGKGNNGGDGLVLAKLLGSSGIRVSVVLAQGTPSTDLALAAFERLGDIPVTDRADKAAAELIATADILVDCIFGTGFRGALREDIIPLFQSIANSPAYKIACDIPSGCNADTGLCDPLSVTADLTVTFHRPKVGMALSPAKQHCGEIRVCDIGISYKYENSDYEIYEPSLMDICKYLPPRPAGSHKGDFGRLLIVAGSGCYYGAAALAANAALRLGAGIVQLASPSQVISALAGSMYECTFLPFEEQDSPEGLLQAINGAGAVLIGCGMGRSAHTRKVLEYILKTARCPVVIDADGLGCLADDPSILKSAECETLLTPHIGELARLCGVDSAQALENRLSLCKAFSSEYGATVVSKSAGTLIVSGSSVLVTSFGNTALSKGGSGDMLAGMAASLLCQGADVQQASALACCILGLTAEQLSKTRSERSILARDILSALPEVILELEGKIVLTPE